MLCFRVLGLSAFTSHNRPDQSGFTAPSLRVWGPFGHGGWQTLCRSAFVSRLARDLGRSRLQARSRLGRSGFASLTVQALAQSTPPGQSRPDLFICPSLRYLVYYSSGLPSRKRLNLSVSRSDTKEAAQDLPEPQSLCQLDPSVLRILPIEVLQSESQAHRKTQSAP